MLGLAIGLLLLNAVICLLMADADADTIRRNRKVNHFFNALIHVLIAVVTGFAAHPLLGVAALVEARIVFDGALNVFRFGWKGLFYVSPSPSSKIDQLEKKLFRNNGWLPKAIYLVVFVSLLFLLKTNP